MKRISIEVTPKEHALIRARAAAWCKKTGRRVGRGPMATWIRELVMREILGGAK